MATVTAFLGDGLRTMITTEDHQLVADEPVEQGGEGAGPGPYDLLLAALGACTAMTLRLYSDRKGWALRSVQVELSLDRIHKRDCEDCTDDDKHPFVDMIERTVHLDGELDAAQRERLRVIADKCPVHRSLEGRARIRTVIA